MMMSTPPHLILASASPRRHELLCRAGFVVDAVRPAHCDERRRRHETAPQMARRLACLKARIIAEQLAAGQLIAEQPTTEQHVAGQPTMRAADWVVLAADTLVYCGGRILAKPRDRAEAEAGLRRLSGRSHRVVTAIAVQRQGDARVLTRCVISRVMFARLSEGQLQDYLASDEWRDAAGGYRIQGRAGRFVIRLIGGYDAVMGLPLYATANLLESVGIRPTAHDAALAARSMDGEANISEANISEDSHE